MFGRKIDKVYYSAFNSFLTALRSYPISHQFFDPSLPHDWSSCNLVGSTTDQSTYCCLSNKPDSNLEFENYKWLQISRSRKKIFLLSSKQKIIEGWNRFSRHSQLLYVKYLNQYLKAKIALWWLLSGCTFKLKSTVCIGTSQRIKRRCWRSEPKMKPMSLFTDASLFSVCRRGADAEWRHASDGTRRSATTQAESRTRASNLESHQGPEGEQHDQLILDPHPDSARPGKVRGLYTIDPFVQVRSDKKLKPGSSV